MAWPISEVTATSKFFLSFEKILGDASSQRSIDLALDFNVSRNTASYVGIDAKGISAKIFPFSWLQSLLGPRP